MTVINEVEFDQQIATREKEALKDVAPKIIEICKCLGIITPDGQFQVTQIGGAKFMYDPLYQVVTVEHGGNNMFRANVAFKTVTVFKRGSWEHAFTELKEHLDSVDKGVTAQRNLVHILENLGLPRP